ncbi:MAG: hypothetical protein ABGY96_22630 [bacterium]|nr:hypothetical protein [Gammaproteobacteria bacterium]HIL97015.1 hypothetical protein [Pseudomonadales bacterium]
MLLKRHWPAVDDEDVDASNVEAIVIIASLQLLNGDLCLENGDEADARSAWLTGLQSLSELPDNLREPIVLMTRALLLDRTNNAEQANALRIEMAQLGFRDTADRALTLALIGVN